MKLREKFKKISSSFKLSISIATESHGRKQKHSHGLTRNYTEIRISRSISHGNKTLLSGPDA
jgi:hypothetical protein